MSPLLKASYILKSMGITNYSSTGLPNDSKNSAFDRLLLPEYISNAILQYLIE